MRVLGFGDNTVDRFLDRQMEYPGGNAVNVATFASQRGVTAAYMGVFGDDDLGSFLQRELSAIGLDLSMSVIKPGRNGFADVRVVGGERVFVDGYDGIGFAEPITLDGARLDYCASFDFIHSSVYSASESELYLLAGTGACVSFDFSNEPQYRTSEYLESVAPWLDIALLSCSHQTRAETKTEMRRVRAAGAKFVIATRGGEGAMAFGGSRFISVPAAALDSNRPLADTMGCGDAFLAGFITAVGGAPATAWQQDESRVIAALHAASIYARDQLYVEGAFGHGRKMSNFGHRTC